MLNSLYSDKLLEAAASIPARRKLEAPSAKARRESRVCGSSLEVEIEVCDGKIVDVAVAAQACALGQAATGLTLNNIIGADIADVYRLREQVCSMLKEDGPPPIGERWGDLALLQAIKDYPQRHASTLLIFDALCDALDSLKDPDMHGLG